MQNSTHEIADLQKTKVNAIKITKVRANGNKFHTGKEWRLYVRMPSSLGGRSFIVVRQADENLAVSKNLQLAKILKLGNFNLKARFGCLNGFMALLASYE